MIIAATGHRPEKLGGYGPEVAHQLIPLATRYFEGIKPSLIISGMALGWDQAVAQAAVNLKIPFVAALPDGSHGNNWPQVAYQKYQSLLRKAEQVVVVSPGPYAIWKMQKRNEWMVNRCDRLVALYNGSRGGTANCLAYAEQRGKPHDNLWEEWSAEVLG